MAIGISRVALAGLLADARSTPLLERCGLLLGDGSSIFDWLPADNVHPEPTRHFELDPAVLIAAERRARQTGAPIVMGHYHFHPDGEAAPSLADADSAMPDNRLWLVVNPAQWTLWRSVAESSAPSLRFGRFRREDFRLLP